MRDWSTLWPMFDAAEFKPDALIQTDQDEVYADYLKYGINLKLGAHLFQALRSLQMLITTMASELKAQIGNKEFPEADFLYDIFTGVCRWVFSELWLFVPPEIRARERILEVAPFRIGDIADFRWDKIAGSLAPFMVSYHSILGSGLEEAAKDNQLELEAAQMRTRVGDQLTILTQYIGLYVILRINTLTAEEAKKAGRTDDTEVLELMLMSAARICIVLLPVDLRRAHRIGL